MSFVFSSNNEQMVHPGIFYIPYWKINYSLSDLNVKIEKFELPYKILKPCLEL